MKSVSQDFKDEWAKKYGRREVIKALYKRRYWNGSTFVYEADWTEIGQAQMPTFRRINWKLDTANANEFLASNVTISLDDRDRRWLPTGAIFAANDTATIGYTPRRMKFRIQFGYILADGTKELVSMFTGLAEDYRFDGGDPTVEITISGNELLLKEGDAEAVSDAFTLESTSPATGDGTNYDFVTASVGVGRIDVVQVNSVTKTEGTDYTLSELNGVTGAKISFKTASIPAAGHTVKASGRKWKANQTIEDLVDLLIAEAGVTGTVNPVIFPGGVSGSKTIDSQADWEAGTVLGGIDTASSPGSIVYSGSTLYSYTDGSVKSLVVPAGVVSMTVDAVGGSAGAGGGRVQATITVTPGETIYYKVGAGANTLASSAGCGSTDVRQGGSASGNRILVAAGAGGYGFEDGVGAWVGGAGGGTAGGDGTGYAGAIAAGKGATQSANGANGANNAPPYGAEPGGGGGEGYYNGGSGGYGYNNGGYSSGAGGGGGSSLVPSGGSTTSGYGAVDNDGYLRISFVSCFESEELDLLAAPTAWGTLDRTETLNGGTAAYYTATSTDGVTWDSYVAISAGGVIQSALKRYLKIKAVLTPSSSLDSPQIDKLVANFSSSTVFLTIADFSSKTCFSAIQRLAKLADYEYGFDGDGSFFFRSRTVSGSPVIYLTQENAISKMSAYSAGYDRVINRGRVRYGSYNGEVYVKEYGSSDAGEAQPTSEQMYGLRIKDDDQSDILLANDSNLGIARARLYYENNYLPRKRCTLQCRAVPHIELADMINATYAERPRDIDPMFGDPLQAWADSPFGAPANILLDGLDMKVVGISFSAPASETGGYLSDIEVLEVL